ncbi:hypothetical protein [Qipengyuania aquimaris]|uniref:hypothetical protein n=1 Tax=Qipengyuania aquimaris TaxID=255984 RepID=UPI001FD3C8C4|nr:hypothetical protein [Qipengyuania aquimaris]UOR14699.1 hypothetical protein LCM05_09380 [Qipengyuania aquimaris]
MDISTKRTKLRDRLSGYWRMEVGNAVIIPLAVLFVAKMSESPLGLLTWLSFLPMCALLLLGGLYWRGKLRSLDGDARPLDTSLAIADKSQLALGFASVLALLAALCAWVWPWLSVSLGDRIAATICSLLAVLEYVNYYHRQLQHFDHAADFRRLIAGQGFRRAQMAGDLARLRSRS